MKSTIVSLVLFVLCIGSAFGQSRFDSVATVTEEEALILREFRRNPDPFREVMLRILGGSSPGAFGVSVSDYRSEPASAGPRDAVDVVVSGGRIAFWGKRRAYEPTSFRIERGERKTVSFFSDDGGGAETCVVVVFKSDGLHFDVPDSYDGNPRHVTGLLIVPETDAWARDEVFHQSGMISSARSISKAEGVSFRVRYVSSRPQRRSNHDHTASSEPSARPTTPLSP